MATTQDFIASLADRYPEDAEDLGDALTELQRQKLNTCERLARLSDSQWQRLGIPLGIESLIREELQTVAAAPLSSPPATASTAPAVRHSAFDGASPHEQEREQPQQRSLRAAQPLPLQQAARRQRSQSVGLDDGGEIPLEPFEPSEGLRRRGGVGGGGGGGGGNVRELGLRASTERGTRDASPPPQPERKGLLGPMDLTPPPDLDNLWQQLLEDCLPPDKRPSLQATWDAGGNVHDKYMMFLEYSSYLRKPEISEEEKAERRKQLEPIMRELGVRPGDEDEDESQSALLWWLLVGFIILVGGMVYYTYAGNGNEPLHDIQAL